MAKLHFSSLGEIISYCTSQKLPFAIYSLPNENQVHCITQDSAFVTLDENSPIPSAPGFIMHPFIRDNDTPIYFIRQENKFSFLTKDVTKQELSSDYKFDLPVTNNIETGQEEHCKKAELAVKAIQAKEFEKVVLSRVLSTDIAGRSPINAFVQMFEKYSSAFVSLVYIPGKLLWLTASPELLVSLNKEEVSTVALAGTKKAGAGNWTEKEKKEQDLVANYMLKTLAKYGSHIIIDATKEAEAGDIVHLKTTFTAKLESGLWDLVMDLHPTPAVCGVPKDKAMKFILDTELHKRKYYSGFLGPCNIDGETNLFVNLRCAELSNNKADLFIGGGITIDSVPQAEWDETVLKANTLLSVLKPALQTK
jgi:isochorismate synthase